MTVKHSFSILLMAFCICISPSFAHGADYCFSQAAAAYNIATSLLEAISYNESKYDPLAINWNDNGTYDFGHMQINSSHYKKLGPERWALLADPCYNTMIGAWILADCIKRFGYNWAAVGCYNAGTHPRNNNKRIQYAQKIHHILGNKSYRTALYK